MPSKYKIVLELVARLSLSILSSVNTSPLAWGSIRTERLLGCAPPVKVERAAFIFQIPDVEMAWQTLTIAISKAVRI